MRKPHGYRFMLDLSEAIEAATAEAADGFGYRGQSLERAVQQVLYSGLVNDEALAAAQPVRVRGSLEADVVRRLGAEPAGRSPAGRLAREAWHRVTRRPAQSRPREGQSRVVFVLDHVKFLDFLGPVLADLDDYAIVSVHAPLAERLAGSEIPHVAIDRECPPRPREQTGPLLRDYRHLAGLVDAVESAAASLGASCLAVVEGNSPYDEVARAAAGILGVPCACVQQGWSPVPHIGFRGLAFDAMAVWGEGFAELLERHNPRQRFVVTGSPAFDAPETGSDLRERLGGRRAVGFFTGTVSPLLAAEDVDEFNALIGQVGARLPDAVMVVREHPAHPLTDAARTELAELSNVVLTPAPGYPLHDVMSCTDVVVSDYSTTLIEGAALLRPAVVLNQTSMPRYVPDVEEHGIGVETTDPAAACDAIVRLVEDRAHYESFAPGLERFRERFFAGVDGRAAERIAALIEELA